PSSGRLPVIDGVFLEHVASPAIVLSLNSRSPPGAALLPENVASLLTWMSPTSIDEGPKNPDSALSFLTTRLCPTVTGWSPMQGENGGVASPIVKPSVTQRFVITRSLPTP